jgi:hypothetical protein
MPENNSVMNPRIRSVEVGIRDLRKISIYPLSVRDQLKTKALIKDSLETLLKADTESLTELSFVSHFVNTITEHIDTIFTFITDKVVDKDGNSIDLLQDMDNTQFAEIAQIVYEVNYSFLAKTVMSFLEKAKAKMEEFQPISNPSHLMKPLPNVVSNMDIDPTISLEKDLEKAE